MSDVCAVEQDVTEQLTSHKTKDLLRFITCGSVDDGKSTLIGRLLYESQLIYDDQLTALAAVSKKFGTTEESLDFALLVDGLAAEFEQGITIDVAYRFFSTDKRKFIVADTPGHEQYTRNMATGASTADLAIVLVDARQGVLTQTCRHSYIVSMLGVKHIILAVNKMDLVGYSKTAYEKIKNDYIELTKALGFLEICAIPISALKGEHILAHSENMQWYQGPLLLDYLEGISVTSDSKLEAPFRMPVQWVNRPNESFRGFSGQIESGQLKVGDKVTLLPGTQASEIESIVTYDEHLFCASAGQAITCTLKDDIDVSRGSVFVSSSAPCEVASQLRFNCFGWMKNQW